MKYLLISALLFILSSCDNTENGDGEQSQPVTKHFINLKVSGADGSSKVESTAGKENNINNIYVFALKGNTIAYATEGEGMNSETGAFQAKLVMSANSGDTYKIVLIANIKAFIASQPDGLNYFKGKTYAELQSTFISEVLTTPLLSSAQDIDNGLVLWGEAKEPIEIVSTTEIDMIHLLRSVARVDVGIGTPKNTEGNWSWNGMLNTLEGDISSTPVPFTLEKVYIFRAQNQYSYIPKMRNAASTIFDHIDLRVKEHSAIGSKNDVANPWVYATVTDPKFSTRQIHLAEADVKITPSAESGDANHTERSAIVVGGRYKDNATSYYRIDFNNIDGMTDILRNHYYQFNIRNVVGDGYPDAETAYSARSMNMVVDVIDWSEGSNEEVIFDGLNWGSLQRRYMDLPGSKNISSTLAVSSNIDANMWTMSLDGGAFDSALSIQNSKFKITKPTREENNLKTGVLKIETLTTLTDNISKKSTLTVHIGDRIKFKITITQTPDGDTEWEDGEDFPHDF